MPEQTIYTSEKGAEELLKTIEQEAMELTIEMSEEEKKQKVLEAAEIESIKRAMENKYFGINSRPHNNRKSTKGRYYQRIGNKFIQHRK